MLHDNVFEAIIMETLFEGVETGLGYKVNKPFATTFFLPFSDVLSCFHTVVESEFFRSLECEMG
jgi:hypothetical protein